VFPTLGIKLWELKGDDGLTPGYVIGCGGSLGIVGTFLASLAYGVEPRTAILNMVCLCGNCNLGLLENIRLHTRI